MPNRVAILRLVGARWRATDVRAGMTFCANAVVDARRLRSRAGRSVLPIAARVARLGNVAVASRVVRRADARTYARAAAHELAASHALPLTAGVTRLRRRAVAPLVAGHANATYARADAERSARHVVVELAVGAARLRRVAVALLRAWHTRAGAHACAANERAHRSVVRPFAVRIARLGLVAGASRRVGGAVATLRG